MGEKLEKIKSIHNLNTIGKHYRKKNRKIQIEFRPGERATAHGGQIAVNALAEEFGLWERIRQEVDLNCRTHKGKGYDPEVVIGALIFNFTNGGASLADAEGLDQDEALKSLVSDFDLHHPPCRSLRANEVFYLLGALAFNLLQCLKLVYLPVEHQSKRIRTLLHHLLLIPVEIKKHSRQLKACFYAPAGWVCWWRSFIGDLLENNRIYRNPAPGIGLQSFFQRPQVIGGALALSGFMLFRQRAKGCLKCANMQPTDDRGGRDRPFAFSGRLGARDSA